MKNKSIDIVKIFKNLRSKIKLSEYNIVRINNQSCYTQDIHYDGDIIGYAIATAKNNEPLDHTWHVNISAQCKYHMGPICNLFYKNRNALLNALVHSINFKVHEQYKTVKPEREEIESKPIITSLTNIRWASYGDDIQNPNADFYFVADARYVIKTGSGAKSHLSKESSSIVIDIYNDHIYNNGEIDNFSNVKETVNMVIKKLKEEL